MVVEGVKERERHPRKDKERVTEVRIKDLYVFSW